jgi:hypothetical protein
VRASISDVLLYRKCPRAWQYSNDWAVPSTPAMIKGTYIHSSVERYMKEVSEPDESHLTDLMKRELDNVKASYLSLEIEAAHEIDFRGHTLLARPDGVLIKDSKLYSWQVKTVSRMMHQHEEYVRLSPHETIYGLAIEERYGSYPVGIVLCRYVKVKEPYLDITVVNHDTNLTSRNRILDGIEVTLNDMEKYAFKNAPCNSNSCVDWMTGATCGYKQCCHHKVDPQEILKPSVNRYPEFNPSATKREQDTFYSKICHTNPGDLPSELDWT